MGPETQNFHLSIETSDMHVRISPQKSIPRKRAEEKKNSQSNRKRSYSLKTKENTCGMLLNRRTWSERVDPGNTSPPIAIPNECHKGETKFVYKTKMHAWGSNYHK